MNAALLSLLSKVDNAGHAALDTLMRQAKSGNREACQIIISLHGEIAALREGLPAPLPELPASPNPDEVKKAVYEMMRGGKISPQIAIQIMEVVK